MTTKIFYLKMIVTIISLNMFLSCSNNPGGTLIDAPNLVLPPETQTGANTFGCFINGKLLLPRNGSSTIGGTSRPVTIWGDVTGNQQYDEIDVRDYKSSRTAQILIHIQNIHQNGAGIYIINLSNGFRGIDGLNNSYIHCRVFDDKTNSYQYYRSFDNCGTVKITRYDFANDIIAGSFTCRVRNSANPSDEIQIEQGRFDINPLTIRDKVFP